MDLAAAIALEWDDQTNIVTGIQPVTMPLTTIAATAIDQICDNPDTAHNICLSYLPTDTALFFTHTDNRILLKNQRIHFKPLLRWLRSSFGIELNTTDKLGGRITHPDESNRRISDIVYSLVYFTFNKACLL